MNQSIECMQFMQSTNIHVQHHDQNKTHPFWPHINTTGQYPPGDDHQNVPKKIDVKSEEHWELNRRRPSVIRRIMKGGNNCLTTREAILQPQFQYSTQKNSNISPSMLPSKYDSESSIIPNTNYYHSTLSPSSKSETPRIPNNHLQHSTLPLSAEPDITIKPEANAVILSDSMHENLYIRQSKHRFEARGNSEIILCQKDNLLNKKIENSNTTKGMKPKKVNQTKDNSKYKFRCSFCKKRFQWFSHWKAHERIHTGQRPYKCTQCERSFTRNDGLQAHMVIHNTKKEYKCPMCIEVFARTSMLDRHIVEHTGIIPYQCDVCSTQCSDAQSIIDHTSTHKQQDRFTCQYCKRTFLNVRRLVRHIRGHTGKNEFNCMIFVSSW